MTTDQAKGVFKGKIAARVLGEAEAEASRTYIELSRSCHRRTFGGRSATSTRCASWRLVMTRVVLMVGGKSATIWPGVQTAAYLSSYFAGGRGRKMTITENVLAGDLRHLVVVFIGMHDEEPSELAKALGVPSRTHRSTWVHVLRVAGSCAPASRSRPSDTGAG